MVWLPTDRVDRSKAAEPLTSGVVGPATPSTVKTTVPVGVPAAGKAEVTAAVTTPACVATEGLDEEVRDTLVVRGVTTKGSWTVASVGLAATAGTETTVLGVPLAGWT